MKTEKINKRFDKLSKLGLVKIEAQLDESYYDDSFIDTWDDVSEDEKATYRCELWQRIEENGVWGVVASYKKNNKWESCDSVWGFVGDEWQGSGYDTDLKYSAIKNLKDDCSLFFWLQVVLQIALIKVKG